MDLEKMGGRGAMENFGEREDFCAESPCRGVLRLIRHWLNEMEIRSSSPFEGSPTESMFLLAIETPREEAVHVSMLPASAFTDASFAQRAHYTLPTRPASGKLRKIGRMYMLPLWNSAH